MADIALVIKSDTAQAEKDFQSFAGSTEKLKKEIEDFQKSFKPEAIDEFIAKNKLAALGISQTQGPLKGLTAETKGYEKEIKNLISSGLSPQSAEIQKLQSQYTAASGKLEVLKEETKKAHAATRQHNSSFTEGIKSIMSYAAAYLSLRAVVGTIKTLTNGLAEQGDEASKNSRKIGITAESYQELKYAADLANVSGDAFAGSMEKLTRNLGEAKNGSGTLATFLKKANPELLAQMKAAKNSEEAMKLLSDEVYSLGNAQDKAALATAAFGKSGMDMLPMLENGASDIAKLQAEAKKYGFVMSTEAAKASEEFLDSQTRLSYAMKGLITQIGAPLMKPLTDLIVGFTNWATEGDNLKDTLKIVGVVLASVSSGLLAFLAITKGVAMIQSFTKAVAGLSVAMSANPIGAIIVAVAALIPLIVLLVKNWDYVKYKVIDFGLAAKEKMLELGLAIREKVMGAIISLLNKMSDLPIVGEMFKKIADNEQLVTEAMKENVKVVQAQREANKIAYEASEVERQKSIEGNNAEATAIEEANARKGKSYFKYVDNVKAALGLIAETENMKRLAEIDESMKFFEQRTNMESEDFDKRIEFLNSQYDSIAAIENLSAETRKNLETGLSKAIEEERKKQLKSRLQNAQNLLTTTGTMINDLTAVLQNFGKQSRALAIAGKAVAVAQAVINTYLGVTAALNNPYPLNIIGAAITLAAGLASVAKIVTTPIPSGETGLSYTVPDIPSNKNDKAAVRASAGEKVTVTPRGESDDKTTMIDIRIEEDTIFSVVQRGFDTGKLTFSNRNIRGGVFA